jgi:uncharacterized membrane protein (UPF0127 family)
MKTNLRPRPPAPRRHAERAAAARGPRTAWVALLLMLATPFAAPALAQDEGQLLELSSFPRSTLTIHSASRPDAHVFRIWLADTPPRHQQGLMFVRDLPAEEGMLFVDQKSRVWGMWMKNTFIPLDMVFIDARGRVAAIFERTVPHSLKTLSYPKPVKAVLELRGGEAARRGIRVGDRVEHPAFRG